MVMSTKKTEDCEGPEAATGVGVAKIGPDRFDLGDTGQALSHTMILKALGSS